MEQVKHAIVSQLDRIIFYFPYNFLREISPENHHLYLDRKFAPWLEESSNHFIFRTEISGQSFWFLYQYLTWDSAFFKYPFFRLFTVLYPETEAENLNQAVEAFRQHLYSKRPCYLFAEIPAEDVKLAQALTQNGFRLTETRLTFYHDQVTDFTYERFPVRKASENDIPLVKKVAAEARNQFDRYHADSFFTWEQADSYLATYAEACVKNLCDTVLVPAETGLVPEAFLGISRLSADAAILNIPMARVLLTAVNPVCKGWHIKLTAETLQLAKAWNCRYVIMTTQATNRAVFRTAEKLGFKLGGITHMLAATF